MKFYDTFVNQAIKDPTKLFAGPWEVVNNPWLRREDKKTILENWEQDQLAMMRAEEENMAKSRKNASPVELYEKIKEAEKAL